MDAPQLELSDVEHIIKMVSDAADPTVTRTLRERKLALVAAAGQMIDADAWTWVCGERNPALRGDAMVTSLVDGGWQNEEERAEMFRVIVHPDIGAEVLQAVDDAMVARRPITRRREECLSDEQWSASAARGAFEATGFTDFLISVFPIGTRSHSAVGLYRRRGRPRFTSRESLIIQVLFQNVGWLHREAGAVPASEHVLSLSPRERQVVMLLMGGDSRKQVARKLNLSEHTVTDYIKAIHRKFAVNSRAELLAKFIAAEVHG